jgi:uncharacterized membrane protein YfcA
MEEIIVILVAFGASMLTFFSGFGLGTILTPAFILFFPPEIAVAATAIVHFLNNLFKLVLIGRYTALRVVLKFGVPALVGAYGGAKLLSWLSESDSVVSFLGFETTYLNLVIGGLILFFALSELLPKMKDVQLDQKWLIPGGVLSGFFGGLSGHQGALRSAFLVKVNLSKEQFIATGVVIACFVDTMRITTYATSFDLAQLESMTTMMVGATLAAFGGAILGRYLLKKITIGFIQNIVGILMIIISILLFLGLI